MEAPSNESPKLGVRYPVGFKYQQKERVWGFLGGSGKFGEGDRKNMFSKKTVVQTFS